MEREKKTSSIFHCIISINSRTTLSSQPKIHITNYCIQLTINRYDVEKFNKNKKIYI